MAYGYSQSNWKLKAEAEALRKEAQQASAQNGAVYDQKERRVVYPAQLNVKHLGQWAGKGYRRESKFGPMLVLCLDQAVPAGSKLLVTPRRQFPKSLG